MGSVTESREVHLASCKMNKSESNTGLPPWFFSYMQWWMAFFFFNPWCFSNSCQTILNPWLQCISRCVRVYFIYKYYTVYFLYIFVYINGHSTVFAIPVLLYYLKKINPALKPCASLTLLNLNRQRSTVPNKPYSNKCSICSFLYIYTHTEPHVPVCTFLYWLL